MRAGPLRRTSRAEIVWAARRAFIDNEVGVVLGCARSRMPRRHCRRTKDRHAEQRLDLRSEQYDLSRRAITNGASSGAFTHPLRVIVQRRDDGAGGRAAETPARRARPVGSPLIATRDWRGERRTAAAMLSSGSPCPASPPRSSSRVATAVPKVWIPDRVTSGGTASRPISALWAERWCNTGPARGRRRPSMHRTHAPEALAQVAAQAQNWALDKKSEDNVAPLPLFRPWPDPRLDV
jgi:hypothetical protein